MKKILVITPFFYPHIGGSERYMEDLYMFLKKKYPNISVDLLCYNTNRAKEGEKYRELNVYRIPCWTILPGQFCLPRPWSLLKFLIDHKSYDLVHSSTRFFDNSWWAPIYAKLIKAKVVLTDHCSASPISNNSFINVLIKFMEMTIVRFSLHFYDQIYAENQKTQEFLKRKFKVFSELAFPGLSYKTEGFKFRNNRRLKIVYVGRMIESKGVNTLFEIARETPGADFIFAGEGPLMNSLKEKQQNNKLTNISILGNLLRKEVSNLLRAADILAYPSSAHSEGLPLALIEAGVAGAAVVATNIGGIGELIKDNKTGVLVEPNDKETFRIALKRLMGDKPLRQKLAKNLYDYVNKNFSWEKPASLIIKELQ